MPDPVESVLYGAEGLLRLLFAGAALYFGWALWRVRPAPSTGLFFWSICSAVVLKGLAFIGLQLPLLGSVAGAAMLGYELASFVFFALTLLENGAWLVAGGALLAWSAGEKRRVGAGSPSE